MTPEEQFNEMYDYLHSHGNGLRENLEIVGNLLCKLGAQYMIPEGETLNSKDLIEYVINDRKTNGETVANATVLQGLTMLSWLNGDKNETRSV